MRREFDIKGAHDIIYPLGIYNFFNYSSGEIIGPQRKFISQLAPLEGRLFQVFIINSGQVLTVDYLTKTLYPDEINLPDYLPYFDRRRINTLVSRLRYKLKPADLDQYLETLRRRGYRWNLE